MMTLARPRYTRVRGNAVSTASKRKSAAVVIAMVSTTWLKPRSERPNLGDPGGCEIAELGEGRLAERDRGQHASIALDERQSGDMSNCALCWVWQLMGVLGMGPFIWLWKVLVLLVSPGMLLTRFGVDLGYLD